MGNSLYLNGPTFKEGYARFITVHNGSLYRINNVEPILSNLKSV